MLQADSRTLDAAAVRKLLGGSCARLFSIDGSHTAEATLGDMRMAAGSLCEGGILLVSCPSGCPLRLQPCPHPMHSLQAV